MQAFNNLSIQNEYPVIDDSDSLVQMFKKIIEDNFDDIKQRVILAKENYNKKIRQRIADKTGLELNQVIKSSNIEESEKENSQQISIEIAGSIPKGLWILLKKHGLPLFELLLHKKDIENSIKELEYQKRRYNDFEKFHNNIATIANLERVQSFNEELLNYIKKSKIIEEILALGPDILGNYDHKKNHVTLYWLSIGLLSNMFSHSIENYTFIGLLHELLHGYTHLGYDKDGNKWDEEAFEGTSILILEGFAQLYSYHIINKYFPQHLLAFNVFLENENDNVYKEFLKWFDENEADIFEKSRKLLLLTRKQKRGDYNQFQDDLIEVRKKK